MGQPVWGPGGPCHLSQHGRPLRPGPPSGQRPRRPDGLGGLQLSVREAGRWTWSGKVAPTREVLKEATQGFGKASSPSSNKTCLWSPRWIWPYQWRRPGRPRPSGRATAWTPRPAPPRPGPLMPRPRLRPRAPWAPRKLRPRPRQAMMKETQKLRGPPPSGAVVRPALAVGVARPQAHHLG